MLDGILSRTGADCAISITGVAGPGGGTEEKPVGTVWTGVAAGHTRQVRRLALFGDRAEIRERSVQAALKILLDMLSDR
jgi:PncC family amidohydrolase